MEERGRKKEEWELIVEGRERNGEDGWKCIS